jgi:hypothetical protein
MELNTKINQENNTTKKKKKGNKMANGAVSFVAYSNFTVSIIDLYIGEILQR